MAKNFFGRWHENLFWKSCSEMSLKKVMYNQHDPYMHTPISAFACYDTPLQASYQSDTCKRRTTKRMFYICFTTCVNSERRSLIHKSVVGVWLSCHLPLGSKVSGLFPDLHLPTHFIAVTTSRTTSTLHDLSPPLLSRVVVTQTGVVELRRSLAGGAGVSSPPIVD